MAAAGNMAAARSRGTVKLEGKGIRHPEDGEVIDFRHNR